MTTVTIHQAKTNLAKLIARAEAGEEIVIARGNEPVVRLAPVAGGKRKREPGLLKGKVSLPDEFFFDQLSDEELGAWEGDRESPH